MAKFNEKMRAHVAGSMNDRPAPPGSSGEAVFPGNRPTIQRQADGRRRLEAAGLIRVDRIIPDPDQPRTEFDPEGLELLAASLKERGQLQPIRVRWVDSADRYVVVVGERRFRAAMMAGLESVACVVADGSASAEDVLEDQLVENALRMDLKPIEQARAYRKLMEARGMTQAQLAGRLRVTQGSISKALALLALPPEIQRKVDSGEIGPSTAYELSRVTDPGELAELAREAAGGSRRDDVKEKSRAGKGEGRPPGRKPSARSFDTEAGPRVTIQAGPFGARAQLEAAREVVSRLELEAEPTGVIPGE